MMILSKENEKIRNLFPKQVESIIKQAKAEKGCGKEIDYLNGDGDEQYYSRFCREGDLCPSCKKAKGEKE